MFAIALTLVAAGGGVGVPLEAARLSAAAITTLAPAAPTPRSVKPTTYCAQTQIIASRIRHQVCQTRAEWLAEGFDPLTPAK